MIDDRLDYRDERAERADEATFAGSRGNFSGAHAVTGRSARSIRPRREDEGKRTGRTGARRRAPRDGERHEERAMRTIEAAQRFDFEHLSERRRFDAESATEEADFLGGRRKSVDPCNAWR